MVEAFIHIMYNLKHEFTVHSSAPCVSVDNASVTCRQRRGDVTLLYLYSTMHIPQLRAVPSTLGVKTDINRNAFSSFMYKYEVSDTQVNSFMQKIAF